jgi:hypothetical protein
MKQYKNPTWEDADNDFAWDYVKLEVKRNWEQASGMEAILPLDRPTFEELEPAFLFGYGARL